MLAQDSPCSKATKEQFNCEFCDYKSEKVSMNTQNSLLSIVSTCKSIIGIVFFNHSKTNCFKKINEAHRIRLRVYRTTLWALSSYARVTLQSCPSTSERPFISKKVQGLKIILWKKKFHIVVDKDAFEEIIEIGWKDMN